MFPLHFSQFLLYTNQLLWLSLRIHTALKRYLCDYHQALVLPFGVVVILERCHQEMALLHVLLGTVDFGLLCPTQAVSSHEHPCSVMGAVVDSLKSITLVSNLKQKDGLRNWPQLKVSPQQSEAFPSHCWFSPSKRVSFMVLCSFELFIPGFSLHLSWEFILLSFQRWG